MGEVDITEDEVDRLTPRARLIRLVAVGLVLAATLGGTFFGQDAEFPFGPFRMYASRNAPDGVVTSLRVEAVDALGDRFVMSAGSVGLRRAEFEGSLPRLTSDPQLLAGVATRYEANNPDSDKLVRVDIIVRKTVLKDGLETDAYTDTLAATWVRP